MVYTDRYVLALPTFPASAHIISMAFKCEQLFPASRLLTIYLAHS